MEMEASQEMEALSLDREIFAGWNIAGNSRSYSCQYVYSFSPKSIMWEKNAGSHGMEWSSIQSTRLECTTLPLHKWAIHNTEL